jgi:hypothetical protein
VSEVFLGDGANLGTEPLGVEWLRQALDMYEFAIQISRSRFRREHPTATEEEIEGMLQEMLAEAKVEVSADSVSLRRPEHTLPRPWGTQ